RTDGGPYLGADRILPLRRPLPDAARLRLGRLLGGRAHVCRRRGPGHGPGVHRGGRGRRLHQRRGHRLTVALSTGRVLPGAGAPPAARLLRGGTPMRVSRSWTWSFVAPALFFLEIGRAHV